MLVSGVASMATTKRNRNGGEMWQASYNLAVCKF